MAEQQHPITPPPELMEQWRNQAPPSGIERATWIATQAARWGADTELRECINELHMGVGANHIDFSSNRESLCSDLRAARRPKPPSLKQQALKAFSAIEVMAENYSQFDQDVDTIRRALESLPD